MPGDSVAGVAEHVRRVVDDVRVEVKVVGRFSAEPSAVSSTESESFRTLERMHGTDERIAVRHYEGAIRIYRQLVLNAAGG